MAGTKIQILQESIDPDGRGIRQNPPARQDAGWRPIDDDPPSNPSIILNMQDGERESPGSGPPAARSMMRRSK